MGDLGQSVGVADVLGGADVASCDILRVSPNGLRLRGLRPVPSGRVVRLALRFAGRATAPPIDLDAVVVECNLERFGVFVWELEFVVIDERALGFIVDVLGLRNAAHRASPEPPRGADEPSSDRPITDAYSVVDGPLSNRPMLSPRRPRRSRTQTDAYRTVKVRKLD